MSPPTIASTFNTLRFARNKEHVIDLLKRVPKVSGGGTCQIRWIR